MPASKAASVQARVCSNSTPPEKVSHEPREISETSRSELPSLRYLMLSAPRSTPGAAVPRRPPMPLPDPLRPRRRAERPAAVDHVAAPVLVGQPCDRTALGDAPLAVVADAPGEGLLEALPLRVAERDGVVVAPHRL